jgi:hypothetical protein
MSYQCMVVASMRIAECQRAIMSDESIELHLKLITLDSLTHARMYLYESVMGYKLASSSEALQYAGSL